MERFFLNDVGWMKTSTMLMRHSFEVIAVVHIDIQKNNANTSLTCPK